MYTDFHLIRKMKQGDEKAFDQFIRRYYTDILHYSMNRCNDRTYAEDLTQETFLRFFTALPDYQYRGKTKNYLYTIAGNLCRDLYKKVAAIPVEETDLTQKIDTVQPQAETVTDRLTVEWALQQLPGELREVIILYYFQELKLSEIAAILHIGLPLVKYRVRRAKKQLGEILKKGEII